MEAVFDFSKRPRTGEQKGLAAAAYLWHDELGAPAGLPLFLHAPGAVSGPASDAASAEPAGADGHGGPSPARSANRRQAGAAGGASGAAAGTIAEAGAPVVVDGERGSRGRRGAPTAAGRRNDAARPSDTGDLEVEEIEGGAAAVAEEERGPIQVEHPEAPRAVSFDIAFAGPTALPPDVVRLMPAAGTREPSPADREAVVRARDDFARVVDEAREQHAEVAAFLRGQAGDLSMRYAGIEQRIDPYLASAGAALDARVEEAQARVDRAADDGLIAISLAAQQARRLVHGAAASARGRIRANATSASQQITEIVNQLAANYTDLLTSVAADVSTAGTSAVQSVQNFVAGGAARYPNSGDPLEDAQQDGRRREVPRLARVIPAIERARDTTAEGYRTAIPQIRRQFDESELGAALHQREREIDSKGTEAVRKAVEQALRSLEEQARGARRAVREMRASARAQLAAERRASRAQIAGQGRELLMGAQGEATGALRGLESAARAGLPAFDNTVRRVQQTLTRTGESGAQPLATAARTAAGDVAVRLAATARLQRERVSLSMAGTTASLQAREERMRAAVEADRDTTGESLDRSAQDSVILIEEATNQHTDAFGQVATGVARAADQWARPLTDVFAEAIRRTRQQQLEARGEGSFHRWAEQTRAGKQRYLDEEATPNLTPQQKFKPILDDAAGRVMEDVDRRLGLLVPALNYGYLDRADEAGATGALRGLTALQGRALQFKYETVHGSLDNKLVERLDGDDLAAARHYLAGRTAAGAAAELRASVHWYNDEEARIEGVMRSLTSEERAQLRRSEDGTQALNLVRDVLDGTELNVFTALEAGNHARADAYKMRDRIDEARRNGEADALHTALAEFSRASTDRDWEAAREGPEAAVTRRTAVQRELALILGGGSAAAEPSTISAEDAAARVERYALQPIEVHHYAGEGEPVTITLTVTGANSDLASALIRHGEGSVEARAARLGVEVQRPDRPTMVNLDTALVDPRLNPQSRVSEDERGQALRDRERMFQLFARNYGGANQAGTVRAAQAFAEQRLRDAFRGDDLSADVAGRLVSERYPTPQTAAMAVMLAHRGAGTNEELLFRVTERMNRDEIHQMRQAYADPALRRRYTDAGSTGDLDNDLGTFRHKNDWFNELSGDERLRMERALLGQPRNDRERAEAAAFAAQQQRQETGWFGAWLASGGLQDQALTAHTEDLLATAGARVHIDADGNPVWEGRGNFDAEGKYIGQNPEAFRSAVRLTQSAAENYAAQIESYANLAATVVAVAGAVAATVATVLTAGAASPLLMATIALSSGLVGMGTRAAISGGRYGWEQAATDLGMTAVQALTAGAGQGLALASRGGAPALTAGMRGFRSVPAGLLRDMGRLTTSKFGDLVLIGAATGGLGGLGQTALSEQTWEKGAGHGIGALLEGTLRGILSGAATATVSNAFEAIPISRTAPLGGQVRTIGDVMGESTNPLTRGLLRGTSSALGGFAGREVELGFERAAGRYRGDAGDIFQAGLEAAGQAALQDTIGGAVEAPIQRRMQARQQAEGTPAAPRDVQEAPSSPRPPVGQEPAAPRIAPETAPTAEAATGGRAPAGEPAEAGARPARASVAAEPTAAAARPAAAAPPVPETAVPPRPAPAAAEPEPGGPRPPRPPEAEGGGGRGRRPSPEEARAADILETMLTEIGEKRRMSAGGLVDDVFQHLPGEARPFLRPGERMPGRSEIPPGVAAHLRRVARERFGGMLQEALLDPGQHNPLTLAAMERLTPSQLAHVERTGALPTGVEFHHLLPVADFPEFAQLPEAGTALPREVHREAGHAGDPTRPVEAGTLLDPDAETRPPFQLDPEAQKYHRARQAEIAEGRAASRDIDRDILIEQRAELARMEGRAARARERGAPDAGLEARIEATRRGIDDLEGMMTAQRPVEPRRMALPAPEPAPPAPRPPDEIGTAAGIAGSRARGDALERARPGAVEEAHLAAREFATQKGVLGDFVTLADATDPSWLIVRTASDDSTGKPIEVLVRVEVVDAMPEGPGGVVPMGRILPGGAADEYVVQLSSRMMEGNLARALAHELTEIRFQHGAGEIPDALRPGGFGAEGTARGTKPNLSPHDRGRLAELGVVAQQIDAARVAGDNTRINVLTDELHHLLGALGMIDTSRAAETRSKVALDAFDAHPNPTVRALRASIEAEVPHAQNNPFLRVPPPADPVGYLDHLLSRLQWATERGNAGQVRDVLEQARHRLSFTGDNVEFRGLDGRTVKYNVQHVARLAANPASRSRLLQELIDYRQANPPRTNREGRAQSVDPAVLDPDLTAAVRRRFLDYKLEAKQFQDWPAFRETYLGPESVRNPRTAEAELHEAFALWVTGNEAVSKGRPASVVTSTSRPDVRAHWDQRETVSPQYRIGNAADVAAARARTGMSIDDMVAARQRAVNEHLTLSRERDTLTAELQKTTDLDRTHAINQRLSEIETRFRQLIPEINNPTELLGEAAGIRFAREKLGLNAEQESQIVRSRGEDVPDLILRHPTEHHPTDASIQRIVVIEAKGGESSLGLRRSKDGTRMVQQGTYEYLESLAVAMQLPSQSPEIRQLGKELEIALRHGMVDYYVVRQPIERHTNPDGSIREELADPAVGKFKLRPPPAPQATPAP